MSLLLCAAALITLAASPALNGSRASAPAARSDARAPQSPAASEFAAAARPLQVADAWTRLGPAGGTINDIAASPSSASVVYAAFDTQSGPVAGGGNGASVREGVYKSTDGGQTWAATGLVGRHIFTVAVDPTNADTVYAGGYRSGVFKSTNGGQTWDGPYRPANLSEVEALALVVHPQITSTLYVSFPGHGLHRSTDGGVTWVRVTGLNPNYFGTLRVSFHPQTPLTVYAAGGLGATFGVYRSTDGGQSWARATVGQFSPEVTTAVAADPSNPSVLYVGTHTGGVFKSTDGGQSWAVATASQQIFTITDLLVNPADPSVVVVSTLRGVYRSTDAGQSWAATSLAPTAVHALTAKGDDPSALLAGARGLGVYRSADAGATWTPSNAGLPTPLVKHLAVNPSDPARLYAGSEDGLYQSGDRGGDWFATGPFDITQSVRGLAADPLNPSILYAALDYAGIYKSVDGGATWTEIFWHGSNFLALAIDPSTPSTLYCSVDGFDVYKTTNGGARFTKIVAAPGLTTALAVDPTNSRVVYAGTSFGVYKSTNGGESWGRTGLRAAPPQGDFVRSLTIDPNNPSTVYATLYANSTGPRDAFRTTDGGQSWHPVFDAAASPPVSIAVAPGRPDLVFAGTEAGVLRSADGGQTFENFDAGMPPTTAVHALAFDAAGQYLYAGTSDGVYRAQVAECGELVTPASQSFAAAGGANSFIVTAVGAGCAPGNPVSGADWITINGLSATTGGVQIIYTVAPNAGGQRGGVIRLQNQVFHVTQAAGPSVFAFASAGQAAGEGDAAGALVTITRGGDNTLSAFVSYATVDDPAAVPCDPTATRPDGTPYPRGAAYARCDYATTVDTVFFAVGETSKTVRVPLVDDGHAEGAETFRLALSQPSFGMSLGAQATTLVTVTDNDAAGAPNPIRLNNFFVRQQYLDFLSREPEVGEPWTGILDRCPNVNDDPDCDRVLVSQSFFQSPEFQLKGLFVHNFYKVAFGRLPLYVEITPDMRSVSGQTPGEVFAKRSSFAQSFVGRAEFKAAYDSKTNAEYVGALAARYNLQQITTPEPSNPEGTQKVTLTTAELTQRLGTGQYTRATVLRAFVQSDEVNAAEFNRAFVAMQYFGYLRRDPEESGYRAWLDYLETHPGDYRTMVTGFVNSQEYALRFGRL